MDKATAKDLVPLTDPYTMGLLEAYVKYRISKLREDYDTHFTMDAIARIQGAIQELKRFTTLRDEVISTLKD